MIIFNQVILYYVTALRIQGLISVEVRLQSNETNEITISQKYSVN